MKSILLWPLLVCIAHSALSSVAKASDDTDNASHDDSPKFRESALELMVMERPELHVSLHAHKLDGSIRHLPAGLRPPKNPYVTTQPEYVHAIARSSSQGRFNENGVRAVLYGIYAAENDLGLYGVEVESIKEADRRETLLREIWVKNVRLDRARVYRKGLFLIVVWNDGVSPECWRSLNESFGKRMKAITSSRVIE